MGKTREFDDSLEKQLEKTKEKKIETFDDLRIYEKGERLKSFNDVREQGLDRSTKTFDDFREKERIENIIEGTKETPEIIERKRINRAVKDIRKIDQMKLGKWKKFDLVEKKVALNLSGKALMKAYDHPNPPLFTEKAESQALGEYGDGWSYNKTAGSDYGIRMNEEGIRGTNQKLFGDDPRVALETYAHEFRHSYQCEQAHALDQGLKSDDPIKAKEWSGNLGENYKQAPDAELAKSDPDRYFSEYEAYRNQPVEKDAREFGRRISSELYGEVEEK